MKRLQLFLAGLVATAATGCAMSLEPIGVKSDEIDVSEWEGVWVHEESFGVDPIVAVIRIEAREDARLRINWLELDGDEVHLRVSTASLRLLNDAVFLNVMVPGDDRDAKPRYYWARVEKDGDSARAWIPDYDELEKLVSKGSLPGEIDRQAYEIMLGRLSSEHERILSTDALPVFPVVFRRIGG